MGQGPWRHSIHVRGALTVENSTLHCNRRLHGDGVVDAKEEGDSVQRALHIQDILIARAAVQGAYQ